MALKNIIPKRRLGKTELRVPALSLGGASIGISGSDITDESAAAVVHQALAEGINYIDTSPMYGESERRIGFALEGIARNDYILSTKTGTHPQRKHDYSWDGTLWCVENSLRLLKTNYLDIVLVHDPLSEEDMETIFSPKGALAALEQLKSQGVIGFIGLGQRRHEWHRWAILSHRFDVILTFGDYHPLHTTALTEGLLDLAEQHDIGVLNGSPLAQGLLTGIDPHETLAKRTLDLTKKEMVAAQRLYDWCQSQHFSPLAITLQFCLRQPLIDCTLTGPKNTEELTANLAAVTTPLPEWIWESIEALSLTNS